MIETIIVVGRSSTENEDYQKNIWIGYHGTFYLLKFISCFTIILCKYYRSNYFDHSIWEWIFFQREPIGFCTYGVTGVLGDNVILKGCTCTRFIPDKRCEYVCSNCHHGAETHLGVPGKIVFMCHFIQIILSILWSLNIITNIDIMSDLLS